MARSDTGMEESGRSNGEWHNLYKEIIEAKLPTEFRDRESQGLVPYFLFDTMDLPKSGFNRWSGENLPRYVYWIDNTKDKRGQAQGGTSTVFFGYDLEMRQEVAIKRNILREYHPLPNVTNPEKQSETIIRETAKLTRQFGRYNLHVPTIYNIVRDPYRENVLYTIMEQGGEHLNKYLEHAGNNRLELLKNLIPQLKAAIHLTGNTPDGVKQFMYRDLKHANLLVDDKGKLMIIDFDLIRYHQIYKQDLIDTPNLIGTPGYRSPEEIKGETDKIGEPSQVFSLGIIFYELLTGKHPFINDYNIQSKEPSSIGPQSACYTGNRQIDAVTQQLFLDALAKDPHDRIQTTDELCDRCLQLVDVIIAYKEETAK